MRAFRNRFSDFERKFPAELAFQWVQKNIAKVGPIAGILLITAEIDCTVRRGSQESDDHGTLDLPSPAFEKYIPYPRQGQSAGGRSVASQYASYAPGTAPFRAAIMISGSAEARSPTPNFNSFNNMATALGCTQDPGAARLACLKAVPASTVHNYTNGPASGTWTSFVDKFVFFRILASKIQINSNRNQRDGIHRPHPTRSRWKDRGGALPARHG